ncbi:hypothetical protein HYY73_00725 [Candidatus Woesearchaeota archaeon]|nr:hypothetical protein [Candidatus Woesearchaeota archaeon]
MDKKDTRVVLKPEFQRELFTKLLKTYARMKLAKLIGISSAMLYHYKNLRVRNISLATLERGAMLLEIEMNKIEGYILNTYSFKESVQDIMKEGSAKRHQLLKDFRNEIPKISEIASNGQLDVEKWFLAYKKLIDFGARQFTKIREKGNRLLLEYTNFANGKQKAFKTVLPRKIEVDRDFLYFFGLWLGDKAGGGRIGVVNKEPKINFETSKLLQKYRQTPFFELYVDRNVEIPKTIKVDKITKKGLTGWAISVYSVNSIFKRFFEYLEANLDEFLNLMPNKAVVFAGLFDAEGNILLEDKCFRWACKDKVKIEIYKKHLFEMGLYRRFDGGNLVGYDLNKFRSLVFPHLRHPKKINACNLLFFKQGNLEDRFMRILEFIQARPGQTNREVAKALKRAKRSSQLKFLEYLDLIKMTDYPKRMFITEKGLASLSQGGKDI